MAEASTPQDRLVPPTIATLKEEAAKDEQAKAQMVRTISMDIRVEREDLKKAAEQCINAILELELDGKVRWVSPSWKEITGDPDANISGKHIADVIEGDQDVFAECVEALRKDDSKSRIVHFSVPGKQGSASDDVGTADGIPAAEIEPTDFALPEPAHQLDSVLASPPQDAPKSGSANVSIHLEAQGIMVYDRNTGNESHTMWMVRPPVSREITIDLPLVLVESLGIGSEILANYLTQLTDVGDQEPENHPPPLPVLCRICERQITPWWFEKHTGLCAQEHYAERRVQTAQEALQEQRSSLVKILDALEAQTRAAKFPHGDAGSPSSSPQAEYKGVPIGSSSVPSSNPSSGRNSPAPHASRSRDSSSRGSSHQRARSFAVRRPPARIVELVLDLCDTAMEINNPSVRDSKSCAPGEIRTQSPQSEGHIQQVLQWQSPGAQAFENEQGLASLWEDTSELAKSKVDAVVWHSRVLEYSERIRIENEVLVSECIEAAVHKAERVQAGELSDSGEESSSYETPDEQPDSRDETIQALPERSQDELAVPVAGSPSPQLHALPSSMAMALRNVSDPSLVRRASSTGSSRTSSPHGAVTPKSYSALAESSMLHKRGSIAVESDAGAESDTSVHSSIASGGPRRVESPSAELSLNRVASNRSRDRKRQSLVLPSLAATGANRGPSPGRGPVPPHSPLRMNKPRLPSGAFSGTDSVPSPITSPVLTHSEFHSPLIRAQSRHHHRRQSSAAMSDMLARPGSPHLSGMVTNPQPRAPQTSIKDFEIIKPISKGAFGSVYLSKKKNTGEYFAIKVLKKADMVAKNQVTNVKAERAIMMWQGESDFVAKLYWTFSSKDYLYLVMEYLNGGDCASLIKMLGALPEDWTKKYIGEVVLCLQNLHGRQIVHRDMKPDNLLIDANGHLKLTDFGLSRMGLIGRQKRAINAGPDDKPPDLLKAGPFRRAPSVASSRSTSFDFQGNSQSPAQTPALHPVFGNDTSQPSYFSLNREYSSSREPSRRTSGHRSDSGDSDALSTAFRRISLAEGSTPIEEETQTEAENGDESDLYALQPIQSNTSVPRTDTPPQTAMPPPAMALFDPEDHNRRFVGTPDYLAPETIYGAGQDEMSDWWSLGCILFECLYGRPPFNAETPEQVFQNILHRRIQWPEADEEEMVSEEAKDLMNRLMCIDPKERLGSNREEKYADGGEEIEAHAWFADINWETLRQDEASFVPISENPEDTEYFDARGATMENFAEEFEDQQSSPAQTPGTDYPDRPYDALSRVRNQGNAVGKRSLMPLHIPPHVRDSRSRRLSEPVIADDFGNFQYKNLNVLEKANKDVIQKLRADTMQAQARTAAGTAPSSSTASPSTAPSLDASPVMTVPLRRALSTNRGSHRAHSPHLSNQVESSPNRNSHPASPMLVQFSTGQHERRKTSSASSGLSQGLASSASLQPGTYFEQAPRLPASYKVPSNTPSPSKGSRPGSMHIMMPSDQPPAQQGLSNVSSPRQRSHTVGSQEGDLVPDLLPSHYKRRSGVFDISPSSSDNEDNAKKALLRVHRRRASSRRLSQISLSDGPTFRTLDVLICEDHPVSRFAMERLLEKMRCRTISVTNGPDAMRYAMSEVKFDIILTEYKLPHMNGTDVARMVRETHNPNARTPIVAVTGYLKELPVTHYFDAMIEKPPTREKLEEALAHLCQWKPAPEGYQPVPAPPIAHSSLRRESSVRDESPTTTTSSGFGGFGPPLSSSRGDSIGSSQTGETDSQFDSIPVIVSRQATNEWDQSELERNFGGLGISSIYTSEPQVDKHIPDMPTLITQTSAPPELGIPDGTSLRKQPSYETIEARRNSIEKLRTESAAESGDDEDEELGSARLRARSPKRMTKRSSKLGTEMMRTNSQGSVISTDEGHVTKDPDHSAAQQGTTYDLPILEETAAEVEAEGKLTPPTLFPPLPGGSSVVFDMDKPTSKDADATPRPHHLQDDPDPTPKASSSPSHQD